MGLPPHFTIVTLGVADVAASTEFYARLGWEKRGDTADGIVWFRTSGTWLGLFGYADLAADIGIPADPALRYRGATLAINCNSESEVDEGFEAALGAGATLVKAPQRAEWGGYSGYVADPDGHLWEIAYAPMFLVSDDGRINIGA